MKKLIGYRSGYRIQIIDGFYEIPKMGSIVVLLDKWGNENHSVIWIEGAYHEGL